MLCGFVPQASTGIQYPDLRGCSDENGCRSKFPAFWNAAVRSEHIRDNLRAWDSLPVQLIYQVTECDGSPKKLNSARSLPLSVVGKKNSRPFRVNLSWPDPSTIPKFFALATSWPNEH